MKTLEIIIMSPLAIIGSLSLMVIDLVRMVRDEPTVDEEWHGIYVDSNINHGQGRKGNEKRN